MQPLKSKSKNPGKRMHVADNWPALGLTGAKYGS